MSMSEGVVHKETIQGKGPPTPQKYVSPRRTEASVQPQASSILLDDDYYDYYYNYRDLLDDMTLAKDKSGGRTESFDRENIGEVFGIEDASKVVGMIDKKPRFNGPQASGSDKGGSPNSSLASVDYDLGAYSYDAYEDEENASKALEGSFASTQFGYDSGLSTGFGTSAPWKMHMKSEQDEVAAVSPRALSRGASTEALTGSDPQNSDLLASRRKLALMRRRLMQKILLEQKKLELLERQAAHMDNAAGAGVGDNRAKPGLDIYDEGEALVLAARRRKQQRLKALQNAGRYEDYSYESGSAGGTGVGVEGDGLTGGGDGSDSFAAARRVAALRQAQIRRALALQQARYMAAAAGARDGYYDGYGSQEYELDVRHPQPCLV